MWKHRRRVKWPQTALIYTTLPYLQHYKTTSSPLSLLSSLQSAATVGRYGCTATNQMGTYTQHSPAMKFLMMTDILQFLSLLIALVSPLPTITKAWVSLKVIWKAVNVKLNWIRSQNFAHLLLATVTWLMVEVEVLLCGLCLQWTVGYIFQDVNQLW